MRALTIVLSLVLLPPVQAAPARAKRPVAAPAAAAYDLRLNPLGLLIGTFDLDFDVALDAHWTVGPAVRYASRSGDLDDVGSQYSVRYLGLGARGNWFRRGVFRDGLYLAPTLTWVTAGVKLRDSFGFTTEYDAAGLLVGGLVGYGWFWERFNLMLGGGFDVTLGAERVRVRDSAGRSDSVRATLAGLALEASLGCTF